MIREGDAICLADTLELEYLRTVSTDNNHYAFVVGDPGSNLKGVERDLDEICNQLNKRGFSQGNIARMYGKGHEKITKQSVLGQLEQLAYLATVDSYVIFYFSGHGSSEGLRVGKETISPFEIYEKIANIRGKKAIILDSCHAGIFLTYMNGMLVPGDTLVLAASSGNGHAYEGLDNRIAGGEYMGKFTAALVGYLSDNRHRLNLKELGEHLKKEFEDAPFKVRYQEPQVEGQNYTLLSVHTQF